MGRPTPNTRTADVQLRGVEALRLRTQGLTLEQIAQQVGYANKSTAKRQIDRLLSEIKFDAVEDYRQLMLAELEAVKARVLEIFYADHVHVADGRVVHDNGQPVLDHGPNLAAAREFRQLTERIAKLIGADAPSRRIVEVITEDVIDAELRALAAEHAELTGDGAPTD